MKQYEAYPVFKDIPASYHLESPIQFDDRLLWVEIHNSPEAGSPGTVNFINIPEDGFSETGLDLELTTYTLDEPVGAVIPSSKADHVVIAKERQFYLLNLNDPSDCEAIGPVIDDNPLVRLNDCRAGFDGRIYAGTMAYDCETPLAKWGVVREDGFKEMITGVKVSNGFGWTEEKDGYRDLIYIDSKSGKVDSQDDEANGVTESSEIWRCKHPVGEDAFENQEVLTNITPVVERQVSGCPVVADGGCMAFDDDGKSYFIVTEYNGAAAHIVDTETGEITAKIAIPALKITSACWVNEYIVFTSTREGISDLSKDDLALDKHEKFAGSGNLFWVKIDGLSGREPYKVQV